MNRVRAPYRRIYKEKPVKSINQTPAIPSTEIASSPARIERSNHPLGRLLRDRRGANLVEYIILVGVVALLAIGAFKTFGGELSTKIGNQATTVQGINDTAEAGP
jgi:Flp pilus assembly pilin Flp